MDKQCVDSQRESQVFEQVARLDRAITLLDDVTNLLTTRLEQVLKDPAPSEGCDNAKQEVLVPLASRLSSQESRIQAVISIINTVTVRLEV